jgi:hypothetical protein
MFLADGIIITPFEILLSITFVAWLLHLLIDRRETSFVRGGVLTPMLVFAGFVVAGFVIGEATNGNRYVAVWEARPLLYLPITYVLVTNLLTSRRAYHVLAVVMGTAWLAHAVLALDSWASMSAVQRERLDSLVDHPSAVQMNVILFAAIAAWMVPRVPGVIRLVLLAAAVPVGWAWLVSERRSAMIGLAVGLIVLGIVMVRLNPRRLKAVAPIVIVVSVAYVGAFWSGSGPAAFPAQSIKSVVATDEATLQDQQSNLYRDLENINLVATIEARPLTGMGFGQKFLRPVPLADISWFAFYEYMPHNSLLWIWIKMGVGGFVTVLFLLGATIRAGVRSVLGLSAWPDVLLVLAATAYVLRYLVFAYVDIAWDTRSMVCLAIAMAICTELIRLPSRPASPAE